MDRQPVFHSLEEVARHVDAPVVTIGNFDGVHIGHQEIFSRALDRAEIHGSQTLALTFSPHPVRFFKPEVDAFRLTTDRHKFALILGTGLDAIFALEFNQQVADLSPEDFVERLLDAGLGATEVIVGANFAFGKNRAGTTDALRDLCHARGIATTICDKVRYGGDIVSSTRIRKALRDNKIRRATQLLGRSHRLVGTVVEGDKRGRKLGFPTANIAPENLVPGNGIYASYLHVTGRQPFPAATSIGERPTFNGNGRTVEAYALGYTDLDLYGEDVELEFVEFLRPERTFDTSDALVEQMEDDVERARRTLEGG